MRLSTILILTFLLICFTGVVSGATFTFTPTNTNELLPYQGERLMGYVDNVDGVGISVFRYVYSDSGIVKEITYAKGYIISGSRRAGAAMYPSLPADGNWWRSTDYGSGWQSTGGITEVYNSLSIISPDIALYAGESNPSDDTKMTILRLYAYTNSDNPYLIGEAIKYYSIHRLSPTIQKTGVSTNPHSGGTDTAYHIVGFSSSLDRYTANIIEHTYSTLGGIQMGSRYKAYLDNPDYYYKSSYTSGTWSGYSGEYDWSEAQIGEFLTNEAGNYTLKTQIYDYLGRAHLNGYITTDIEVETSVDYIEIYTRDTSENPIINNVFITLRDATTDIIMYSGALQGDYLSLSFAPPRNVKVQVSASGYTPVISTVTKNFTALDNTLIYYLTPLSSAPSGSVFSEGYVTFNVKEQNTLKPIQNAKITIGFHDYYTNTQGVVNIPLLADGVGNPITPFVFGEQLMGDIPLAGDKNGDGIDNIAVARAYPQYSLIIYTFFDSVFTPSGGYTQYTFGQLGDSHIVLGDWDNSGIDSPASYNLVNGRWYFGADDGSASFNFLATFDNLESSYVVSGDWDGDGIDTIATFRNGAWSLWDENTALTLKTPINFGQVGDVPIAGDWNGDGTDTIGVRRDNLFILADSNTNTTNTFSFFYGKAEQYALIGDVRGDGKDKPMVWDSASGKWYFIYGRYDYTISIAGKAPITGSFGLYEGQTNIINILSPSASVPISTRPTGRPEGESGIGLIQVLSYLMTEEGIEEESDQNIILGILIMIFCVLLVGGLTGSAYGVIAGGLIGFILAVITGFIPIWIPLCFIAITGVYILMKTTGGD